MKQDLDIPEDSIEYLQEEENWEWFMQEVERMDFSSFLGGSKSCVAGMIEDENGLSSGDTFFCGDTSCDKCVFNIKTLEGWEAEGDE